MDVRRTVGISVLWIPLAFLFDGVTVLVMPVRLAGVADPAATIGLLSFAGLGAALVVQPIAGHLSDRLRGRVERRAFVAVAGLPVLAGLWLLGGPGSTALVVLGYVLVQTASSAIQAGQQTLIPEHADRSTRGRLSGWKTAFDVGGAFLAFLVLGAILSSGDTTGAVIVVGAVLVAGVVTTMLLAPRARAAAPGPHSSNTTTALAGLPAGFARLVAARFLFLLGTFGVGRFLLLLAADRLGLEPAAAAGQTGALLAVLSLATAGAALPAGILADRFGRERLMAAGVALSAAGIVALIPPAGMVGLLAGGLVMSIGTAAFVAANWAATTDVVPAAESGRLMGLANVGTGGAAACAGLLGLVLGSAGFTFLLLMAAAATLAAAIPLAVARRPLPPALEQPA